MYVRFPLSLRNVEDLLFERGIDICHETVRLGQGMPFRNCTEARTAGAAPVYRGQPGYGEHLDRDGDGVGCEPYRGR